MESRLVRSCVAAVAVTLFLASAPRADAESLTMVFHSTTGAAPTSYSFNGNTASTTPGPYYWMSQPPPNLGPPTFTTMCIELTQGLPTVGAAVGFFVVNPADAPTIGDQARADALTALYGNYFNTTWTDPATANSAGDFRAFQLAVWEIMTDGAGSSLNRFTTGNFLSDDANAAAAQSMLNTTLNDIAGGEALFQSRFPDTELVALVTDSAQDQLLMRFKKTVTASVPAPPGLILAGIGMFALLGRARWKRQPPAIV